MRLWGNLCRIPCRLSLYGGSTAGISSAAPARTRGLGAFFSPSRSNNLGTSRLSLCSMARRSVKSRVGRYNMKKQRFTPGRFRRLKQAGRCGCYNQIPPPMLNISIWLCPLIFPLLLSLDLVYFAEGPLSPHKPSSPTEIKFICSGRFIENSQTVGSKSPSLALLRFDSNLGSLFLLLPSNSYYRILCFSVIVLLLRRHSSFFRTSHEWCLDNIASDHPLSTKFKRWGNQRRGRSK